jgi:hypothetical protein
MKPLSIAVASLLLLSAVWAGTDASAAPAAYAYAPGRETKTPRPKPTRKVETKEKVTREKKPTKTPKPERAQFSGEVLAVGGGGLTIKDRTGGEIFVQVNTETVIRIPTLGKGATLEDIRVGARVVVRALRSEDGALTALSISVSPGKPAPKHHVGVVTAYTEGASITILAHDGNEYTFLITDQTKILPADRADELAVGRRVTVICPRDVTGGPFTAAGIVVHPEVEDGDETPGTPTATPTPTETPTPTDTPTPEVLPSDTPTPASD